MARNILEKVIEEHLVSGRMEPGEPISYRIDQVLLQDATGTMAWMEFEQLDRDRVQVPLVVQYVDHNMIQLDYKNPDDRGGHGDGSPRDRRDGRGGGDVGTAVRAAVPDPGPGGAGARAPAVGVGQ